jgi:hypothetical protein
LENYQNKRGRFVEEVDERYEIFDNIQNDDEKLNRFFYEIFYPRFQYMLS